jgi:hypothetical protein
VRAEGSVAEALEVLANQTLREASARTARGRKVAILVEALALGGTSQSSALRSCMR